MFHVARCQAARKTGDFDRNEVKEFKWVSRPAIREMIEDRSMKDGYSLTALLLYLLE
jgi:isopentenyldiphosphate isomerase